MNPAQNTAIELLRLADEKYRGISAQELESLGNRLAPDDDAVDAGAVTPVLAIGAPRAFDVRTDDRIPVLMAKRLTGQRAWEVDMPQNLTWILVDLRTGDVRAVTPLTLDKRRMATPEPSRTPPPPTPVNRTAVTYGVERIHLPPVFGRDWPSDRYAATLAVYDWVSNTVVVERRPAPAPAPEKRPVRSVLQEASPGLVPGGRSLLSVPLEAAPGGPLTVRGILSIPREQAVVLKGAEPHAEPLLPVALVLLKLDSTAPAVINLAVPVSAAGALAGTRFAVDLRRVASVPPGEYQVYMVAGRTVTGPETLRVP